MELSFNPTTEQMNVIEWPRSAFVVACPGAGKTRVMIERARHVLSLGARGKGIAFLSFTKTAVSELEQRLRTEGLLPTPPFPNFIGTFDRFLWQFLIAPFGVPGCPDAAQLIPDKDDRIIRPFDTAQPLPLSCFDRVTGALIASEAKDYRFDVSRKPSVTTAYVTAARKAREQFLARGEVDFVDVRTIAEARLSDSTLSARITAALAARFCEVIVDEAQDCNPADLEIINALRKAKIVTKVICDPHQSIYAFRGGVTEELTSFGETFDQVERFPMHGNFRSSAAICRAIVSFRPLTARVVADLALGKHRDEPTPVHILSYGGTGVPATIGAKFAELVSSLNIDVNDCPVVAATHQSAARAIGQPIHTGTHDLTIRLGTAVTAFHFAFEPSRQRTALEELHQIVLELEGRRGAKTYHQYLAAEGIGAFEWRPQMLRLVRDLKYDTSVHPSADAWHAHAKTLLAPYVATSGSSIAQRLRRNADLPKTLGSAPDTSPPARTIHSVKGMEFPAVCVVMTPRTAKGIIDYLESGTPSTNAEEARKLYVGASRAERLLAFAVPKSQQSRLSALLESQGVTPIHTQL